MALLASGDLERARKALERARDLDVRTHRMTRPLEAALVRVAEETGTPWVDLRPVFADALDAATSRRLFVDHLHPTAAGHERIADALLPAAARALGLAPATAAPGAAARPGAG
jgi:lysophospholipase L1-like esterase